MDASSWLIIKGKDEVQAALAEAAKVASQGGDLQQAVGIASRRARTYAVEFSHVWTGALKASHTIVQSGTHAEIYPSPAVINPRTKRSPAEYGPFEHRKGGDHAFYARTMAKSDDIVAPALAYLRRNLP